ncbi:MAG: ABC transporter permease [Bacteroidales bacterium]|nr:ABC transporter permease [Bacteroidales bacterium]
MIWSISWKNVWRNKLRSLVVIVAFFFGIFGGIYVVAVMIGMIDQRVKTAIGNEVSHIQIHHPGFLENNELKYTIQNQAGFVDSLESLPEVVGVSSRIKIMGMANTSGNASGIMITGIYPDKEKEVTDIAKIISDHAGTYLNGDDRKQIVIGEKLAKNLKLVYYQLNEEDFSAMKENKRLKKLSVLDTIKDIRFRTEQEFDLALEMLLGESQADKLEYWIKQEAIKYKLRKKIVISFQSYDGHLAYDAFRVAGVYKTSNTMFDGMNVFVHMDDIAEVASIPANQVNEIAIMLSEVKFVDQTVETINSMRPTLSTQAWDEIRPDVGMVSEALNFYLMIFMVIILLALGFGIVNTMLMAVLERIKELGMLMAIGMNKKRVFSMIMLETVFLSLVGAVFGMFITWLLVLYTGKTGLDMSAFYGEGFEVMGYSAKIYPKLGLGSFVQITVMVILTGIIASIYPARKAMKLNPAEALRIDM